MQKSESLDAQRSPQPFFEKNNPINFGKLVGREVKDDSRLEEQNEFVKNLFHRILSLESALSACKESHKKKIAKINFELEKSSRTQQIKTAAIQDSLEDIKGILKGLNQQIRHLENGPDQVFMDSINAMNTLKTQVSILEKNIAKRLEDLESEVEYNAKETSIAFDKICLTKRYIESRTGEELSESNIGKPNKIKKMKAAL
ncbi:hypothetical protein [Criblamydia sequanensis]|uniref:Uncharacterized protein n=1 Tax=Candidatus Criblamydia sequanensis CRIB-18 TaxID=1437425 RepID=A0A090E2Y0_9BACT|nr:hypothetical protein [Criblamydia sequanensis]CDR34989.1 hypothetical protein CSEC_2183 [Criblamydia sequanensis CRIB-18]